MDKSKLINQTIQKYYSALDRVLSDDYSIDDEIVVKYFYTDLAKSIVEEFGDEWAKKTALSLLILTKY